MTYFSIRKIIPTLLLCLNSLLGYAQSTPVLKPKVGSSNDYSKAEQAAWSKVLDQYEKVNSGKLDYKTVSQKDQQMMDELDMGEGPHTEGVGCSWYCGGGPYKLTSSSSLKADEKNTYQVENIHDFDLFTAWVPDTQKEVIGAKIHFYFKPFSPRVTTLYIYNGYIKNKDLWQANARAKKLRLYINNKPKAILELQDVTNCQTFGIEPIQSIDHTKDLILTLEVLEIYKGSKYSDLAISEINFEGLDVHCFAAGTQITMADHSTQAIESIKSGDYVLSFDTNRNTLISAKVTRLITARHTRMTKIAFSDREIIVTEDHPFWVENKQWASVNPERSNDSYLQNQAVQQLAIGDKIWLPQANKYTTVQEMEIIEESQLSYTIELENGDSFIANGMLVKTEMLKPVK
ncbi:Hint domain-containing protein [Cytophagaceae bacterium DM2B3-1]|uniref:Hint domain-containing protein n=1 Tax=Xanthocytophaga flava TaxID=3048013 RepID=A0ABT7CT41_9BACT|nr:Hint domain-containing protein [Xanthocytophaga flavus]MDJ1471480.1 Hint domain-containing protein [Xanthocytophaga flavus]MDJ1496671.1 Hint domain-containing protein [Xanthocytophaga flavus]